MDVFNGNPRLQDHVMYALDWAIFLRHNIDGPLAPFLLEWKEETIYKNMLHPGGDPEEFAYRIAKKSDRGGDQFVVGYEGMLTDEKGNKVDALIIKGYDRTQTKGVFLAQIFEAKEKTGQFRLVDNPTFISNPDLPFAVDENLTKSYQSTEVFYSGMALKNGDRVGIFSHDNPSVIADGIKRFLRGKVSESGSEELSGRFECAIAPGEGNTNFLKYTILRTIEAEKHNQWIKAWEQKTGKQVMINCKYGDEIWREEFKTNEQSTPPPAPNAQGESSKKSASEKEHDDLVDKYRKLNKFGLDAEFMRIAAVPNARTNINCLKQMTALMQVYEEKGIELPKPKANSKPAPKSGCAGLLLFLLGCGLVIQYFL